MAGPSFVFITPLLLTPSVAENTTLTSPRVVGHVAITDFDGGRNLVTLEGADAELFQLRQINNLYYALELRPGIALDHETNPKLDVTVRARDVAAPPTAGATSAFTVRVNDVPEAPQITSNGGGDSATIRLPGGQTLVTTVQASDPDAGAKISYRISGGTDANLFTINASTGALSFRQTPTGEQSSFNVQVEASDSGSAPAQTDSLFGVLRNLFTRPPALTDTQNLTIIVNTPPVLTVPEALGFTDTPGNDSFAIRMGTLMASDADGDALTYGINGVTPMGGVATQVGSYGTLAVNTSTGAYTYTPNDPAIEALSTTASEAFTVTVSASNGASGIDTVSQPLTINITGVNDAPVANADTLEATEDTPITYTAAQLLGNDTDAEGNTLSIASVTGGTGGTAQRNEDGSVTFTPMLNFNGAASFTYTTTDGSLASAPTTVTVNVAAVQDPAVIGNPSNASVTEDVNPLSGFLNATGTIPITDPDNGEMGFRTMVVGAPGNKGALNLIPSGLYTYSVSNAAVQFLNTGETATDTFTVTSLDGTTKDVVFRINGRNEILSIAAANNPPFEGFSGSTSYTYTVTRTGDITMATSASFAVTGSGVNPAVEADFVGGVLPSGTVNFAANSATASITVDVQGDIEFEPSENFAISLSGPAAGYTISASAGSVQSTINNDDEDPSLPVLSIVQSEGEDFSPPFAETDNTRTYVFEVYRDGPLDTPSSATWTVAGTGPNPANAADFAGGAFPTGTVSFAVDEDFALITVLVQGDTTFEANEAFSVTLSNPVNAALGLNAGTTNAPAGSGGQGITTDTYLVVNGGGNFALNYDAFGVPDQFDIYVNNILQASTNMPVSDEGTLTVAANLLTAGDLIQVVVTGPDGTGWDYDISYDGGLRPRNFIEVATIINDDPNPALPTITGSVSPTAAQEGNDGDVVAFTFGFTRTGPTDSALSLPYYIDGIGNDQVSSSDFVGGDYPFGTLEFLAGSSTASVVVEMAGDMNVERNDGFAFYFDVPAFPANATANLPRYPIVANLIDDDGVIDDFAANPGTAGSVLVGGSVTGAINSSSDDDWFSVSLTAGVHYRIAVNGQTVDSIAPEIDPVVEIYDDFANYLVDNYDDDNNGNIELEFTADRTGVFFIGVYSDDGSNPGGYRLSVETIV